MSNSIAKDLKYLITFSETHKFVRYGKDVLFEYSSIDDQKLEHKNFYNIRAAEAYWSGRRTTLQVTVGEEVVYKSFSTPKLFIEGSPHNAIQKHKFKGAKCWDGVVFNPGVTTYRAINRFNGFPIAPVKGNLDVFNSLLKRVIPEESERVIVMDYFAHLYQKPMDKPKWCLALKGGKGVGKNMVVEMLGEKLLNKTNYFITDNKEQALSKFNAHLETNLLLTLNELIWTDRGDYDSILKGLITESSRAIERKGFDSIVMDNYSRIVLISNGDWMAPASGRSERRYAIIKFLRDEEASRIPSDKEFANVYKWYHTQGGKEALMYELMNREIPNNFISKAPYTAGLTEQLEHSLKGVDLFVKEALESGYFGQSYGKGETVQVDDLNRVKSGKLYNSFKSLDDKTKVTHKAFVKKVIDLTGAVSGNSGGRYLQFPDLNTCAEHFKKNTGIKLEDIGFWNDEILLGEMK